MGLINYPNNIRNQTVSSHTELNNNFQTITTLVNKGAGDHGNIDGDNISNDAQLTVGTMTVSNKIITTYIDANGTLTFKLPSADGSHSVKFKDHTGTVRLEVKSDGEVYIS